MSSQLQNELFELLASPDYEAEHIDELLDIKCFNDEKRSATDILLRYPNHYINHDATDYQTIIRLLRLINPSERDIIYDLGSGYGRFSIVGAIAYPSQFIGIEIVSERVLASRRAAEKLSLNNVKFKEANIFDTNFSNATVIFSFNPVYTPHYKNFFEHVTKSPRSNELKIVLSDPLAEYFEFGGSWVKIHEVASVTNEIGMKYKLLRFQQ